MENNRNSMTWLAFSKSVETQVSAFLRNGLVQRFQQLDYLLNSADFQVEPQMALIRNQVANYGEWSVDDGGSINGKSEPAAVTEAKEVNSGEGASVGTPNAARPPPPPPPSDAATGNGATATVTREKLVAKRKLVDSVPSDGDTKDTPKVSPPKKPFQSNWIKLGPGPPAPIPGTQPDRQLDSSGIITKRARVAIPLIRSVLGDINLLKTQLNLMMTGPNQLIELMETSYFKGRLSAALESVKEMKEIAENIDLEMFNYHVKRTKLISELGKIPAATPDVLLSIVCLDSHVFGRLHQILVEFRNTYYLALTMDHVLSENAEKNNEGDGDGNSSVENLD